MSSLEEKQYLASKKQEAWSWLKDNYSLDRKSIQEVSEIIAKFSLQERQNIIQRGESINLVSLVNRNEEVVTDYLVSVSVEEFKKDILLLISKYSDKGAIIQAIENLQSFLEDK